MVDLGNANEDLNTKVLKDKLETAFQNILHSVIFSHPFSKLLNALETVYGNVSGDRNVY